MSHNPNSLFSQYGSEVTEVSFLIPSSKAEALERQASRTGQTLGELLRRMISSHPDCQSCDKFPMSMCQDNQSS